MKRIILFIIVILGFSLCAFAQAELAQPEPAQEGPAQDDATFFQKVGKFFLDLDAKADQADRAQNEQGEKRFAVGAGLEWNMNSRHNFSMGFPVSFDYKLPVAVAPFSVGVTFTTSVNFTGDTVLEPAAMFRWYFLGIGHTGFFAQADLGAYIIFEDNEIYSLFLGGLRGGYRMPLGSRFYVEPSVRVGYPFAFGVGATAGVRF